MRRAAVAALWAAVWSCCPPAPSAALAGEKTAADLFPATCVGYVEAPRPGAVVDLIVNHPLVKRLGEVDAVQQGLAKNGKLQETITKVKELEEKLGQSWRQALGDVAEQGVYFAVEPASQGGALLLRGRDAEAVRKLRDQLREVVEQERSKKGLESNVKESTYRGQSVWQAGDLYHALMGKWLLVTNKETLGRQIVDNYLEDETTLADEPLFQEALATAPSKRCAWAYLRLDVLRLVGAGKKVFADQLDDPAAELLLGGVAAALQKANYVTMSLEASAEHLHFVSSVPFNAKRVPDSRAFYFATAAGEQAPAPLTLPNRLLSLVAYRDAAKWWSVSEESFPEAIAAKLAQADSQLTLFFSGKDFSTEILGKLEPQYQFVLTRQDYSPLGAKAPDVKLPAGALIVKTKPDADLARTMKIAFQSIVGLANLNAGQEGRPQFELESQKADGVELTAATYGPAQEADDKDAHGIHRNFSPTLAVSSPWIVLSSTQDLADETIAALKAGAKSSVDNARLELDYAPLAEILRDNRDHLVHQNMLEKGHDRAAAETEIGLLFEVVSRLRGASARLTPGDGKLSLELNVQLSDE